MDEDFHVIFEVRNDKDRGILVLTIRLEEMSHNVHFFKYHHQPIDLRPEQVQLIIRAAKPKTRTKSVTVNIVSFASLYWNVFGKFFEFKGMKLMSTELQVLKLQEAKTNKAIGAIKRKKTVEASKKNKEQAIREKLVSDEMKFQLERAKRIKEASADLMETDATQESK